MQIDTLILLLNLATTLYMVGVIWFVQIVHYPLFGQVGEDQFARYESRHQKLTSWVVGPPMLVETLTSVLLIWYPPPVNPALVLLGVALLFVIWVSTAFLQVPCHSQMLERYVASVHRQLVLTNWLRTVCWTIRGVLVCWFVAAAISNASA